MRIAIDSQSTFGRKTGIGQYSAKLLEALRRVAPENEYVELSWGRDVVMRTDRRLRWQQWEVPRRARASHCQLLHVPGFDAPHWKPCPLVLTVHDLIGMLFPQNLPRVSRLYWASWLPYTVRFADAIIADSEATRQDIERLLHVPSERVEVVPLAADERFQPKSEAEIAACRTKFGLSPEFILYVGTLEPRKGVDTLIDAFAKLAGQLPHDLVLAGKRGWYWEPLIQRVSAHAIEDRVRFLDYVSDEDLPSLYGAASAFVFPSRYEGFGLPVLEAMACGTPVICSDASSLPEVAGQAAVLVPPDCADDLAQALETLLADRQLREDLKGKGLQRAAEFTWEMTAQATIKVYQKVAEAGSN